MDNLTPVGKLFFANLISFVNNDGYKFIWKLKGDPEKIQAFAKVIVATKAFQEETKKPDATIDKITKKMQEKNQAIQEFEAIFGKKWPL